MNTIPKMMIYCLFFFRKQRNSISVSTSSTNTTINGDSGNVSQEEHDDDQERYFDKIERLKRTENEVNLIYFILEIQFLFFFFL
jgi:hypothetical protein